jgi:hypothetical protein
MLGSVVGAWAKAEHVAKVTAKKNDKQYLKDILIYNQFKINER